MRRPRKTTREMSEWVLHCAVNQRHIRRSQPTRKAALKDACWQLLQGHAVNRIVGPNETITAERVRGLVCKTSTLTLRSSRPFTSQDAADNAQLFGQWQVSPGSEAHSGSTDGTDRLWSSASSCVPAMGFLAKQCAGKILITGSEASLAPIALMTIYAATKAFVYSFALSLREELKDSGVTVTALLPGATQTNFFMRAKMEKAKFVREGKMADPADVARDGYKALIKGDDHIVTPLTDKIGCDFGEIRSGSYGCPAGGIGVRES